MILNIKANPSEWKKECWIAIKQELEYDDDNNEIVKYSEPVKYEFNYQPISSNADLMEFGEKASMIQKAIIPIEYKDMFKEFDVAYLDGAKPSDGETTGANANYKLHPPRNQNSIIQIYFEKLTGK